MKKLSPDLLNKFPTKLLSNLSLDAIQISDSFTSFSLSLSLVDFRRVQCHVVKRELIALLSVVFLKVVVVSVISFVSTCSEKM